MKTTSPTKPSQAETASAGPDLALVVAVRRLAASRKSVARIRAARLWSLSMCGEFSVHTPVSRNQTPRLGARLHTSRIRREETVAAKDDLRVRISQRHSSGWFWCVRQNVTVVASNGISIHVSNGGIRGDRGGRSFGRHLGAREGSGGPCSPPPVFVAAYGAGESLSC